MADNLISSAIPNLINGVSQQPDAMRLSSQCALQENAYATVVNGLEKRPPTQHIAQLSALNVGPALVHTINRSVDQRYEVLITNGDLQVFGVDGTVKTVAFPQGKAYLSTASPLTTLKALTIADYTFIINTAIVTAMAGTTTDDTRNKAIVFVKQGQYGTTYNIVIDGSIASSYTTSNTDVGTISTDHVAQSLQDNFGLNHQTHTTTGKWTEATRYLTQTGAFTAYTYQVGDLITITGGTSTLPGEYTIVAKISNDTLQLASSLSSIAMDLTLGDITSLDGPNLSGTYTITRQGSVLYMVKIDGTPIDIVATDSFGNRAISVAVNTVDAITNLPLVAPNGFLTKVIGANGTDADDYYVKFVPQTTGQAFGNGNWHETIGPNVHTAFDASTMPWVLIHNGDGTFTFQEGAWANRVVGDETSAPNPSFVGQPVTDAMLFENRLGFISKENVILSEAGKFFNFWPTTVTTLLDSDPIDVASTASPASGVSTLKAAVPFQSKLMLFSDHSQFVLSGADILTPKTVSIHETTEYISDLGTTRPIISGKNIFFPFKRGSFSGLNEYFIDIVSGTYDAAEATKHVPKYIPGSIIKLTTAPNEDFLVALTAGDQSSLYVYKYYWNNNQKLQSCWSRWTFDGSTILNVDFIDTTLYITFQRADGVYLESLSIDPGALDDHSTYVTLLDRKVTDAQCSVSYSSTTGLTTWSLPYPTTGTVQVVTRYPTGVTGVVLKTTVKDATSVTARGDFHTTAAYLGQTYKKTYRFSKPQLHEQQQGGATGVVSAGRVQLRHWMVLYDNTGYFRAEVTPEGRDTGIYVFGGRTLGEFLAPLGVTTLSAGKFSFPVYSRADRVTIDIINDSPYPSRILSAEFEAMYVTRSSRF